MKSLLGDRYRVLEMLGKGGTSVVYLVEEPKNKKQYAVKEIDILSNGVQQEEVITIYAEANRMKNMNHPGIPKVYGVLELQDKVYIVMEYIKGITIETMLKKQGLFTENEIYQLLQQLVSILKYLHSRTPQIIYRDLKPSNIMLKQNGQVTLIDYGLATGYKKDQLYDKNNIGTRYFAAPEQFQKAGKIDVRTDIFNLGATLYYLATGHYINRDLPLQPLQTYNKAISPSLATIINRAIKPHPEDRYQSVEMLEYAVEVARRIQGGKK